DRAPPRAARRPGAARAPAASSPSSSDRALRSDRAWSWREERRAHVSLAGVRDDRDDPRALELGAAAHLDRRPERGATRDPGPDALAPRHAPGGLQRVPLGHRPDLRY